MITQSQTFRQAISTGNQNDPLIGDKWTFARHTRTARHELCTFARVIGTADDAAITCANGLKLVSSKASLLLQTARPIRSGSVWWTCYDHQKRTLRSEHSSNTPPNIWRGEDTTNRGSGEFLRPSSIKSNQGATSNGQADGMPKASIVLKIRSAISGTESHWT